MGLAFLFYTYLGPKPLPPAVEGGATFPMIKEMANSSSRTCRRASAPALTAEARSSTRPRSQPRQRREPPKPPQ
jgi:hypothetical protein